MLKMANGTSIETGGRRLPTSRPASNELWVGAVLAGDTPELINGARATSPLPRNAPTLRAILSCWGKVPMPASKYDVPARLQRQASFRTSDPFGRGAASGPCGRGAEYEVVQTVVKGRPVTEQQKRRWKA